jgi:chromosome segregation ATPase
MSQISESVVHIDIRNIGGIDEASVTLPEGVSILTGRNATNRTSFLQALMAGLGSRQSSLKGDAQNGEVTLEFDNETYTRTLQREDNSIIFNGDPYLDDPELADLFAFLLEDNEARRAVARGDDLREIIMRPIDMDSIEAEIRQCKNKRDEMASKIEELDGLERDLPDLEADRREKAEELKTAKEKRETIRKELDDLDGGIDETRTRKQELEEAFQRVRDARSDLEDLEFNLETERSTLSELKAERKELKETIEEGEEPDENPDRLAGRIDELRRRKRSLDDDIKELGSVIGFNEDMIEGSGIEIDGERHSKNPTSTLTGGDQTVCWTCGSEVKTDQIEATLDRLRELRSERLDERNEIREDIEQLTDKQSSIRKEKRTIEHAKQQLDAIETEIESTVSRIAELEDQVESKCKEIKELEAEAESIDVDDYDETLELHREANEIELQIERLEDKIDELDDEIHERETAIERREELKAEREELAEQLTRLRTRVDRIEENAVKQFNEHMENLLEILKYKNLDRIWIERQKTEVREGRRKVTQTQFNLHIVRSSSDGTAYEDTVDHLSESEREVTGLVFALAGYLVHDVYEMVPFILLDSLEAIDSNRIARTIDYFQTHANYLVAALLPEDAAALSDEYAYIETIN